MKLFDAVSPHLTEIPSAPVRRDQIDKVAKEFEGLLVNEVFKVMRKTAGQSYLNNQMSQNFQSMLDQEYATMASSGGGFGLADMLALQLGEQVLGKESPGEKLLRTGAWSFPVSGDLTLSKGQKFGADRKGLRPDECGDGHCGVDFGRQVGTPIVAAAQGKITRINFDEKKGGGIYVGISHHGEVLETRYMHLDRVAPGLKMGQPVEKGQYIGDVGNTGPNSTGAHLHFEIFEKGADGKRRYIDPEPYLKHWQGEGEARAGKGEITSQVHEHLGDVHHEDSGSVRLKDAMRHRAVRHYKLGEPGGGKR